MKIILIKILLLAISIQLGTPLLHAASGFDFLYDSPQPHLYEFDDDQRGKIRQALEGRPSLPPEFFWDYLQRESRFERSHDLVREFLSFAVKNSRHYPSQKGFKQGIASVLMGAPHLYRQDPKLLNDLFSEQLSLPAKRELIAALAASNDSQIVTACFASPPCSESIVDLARSPFTLNRSSIFDFAGKASDGGGEFFASLLEYDSFRSNLKDIDLRATTEKGFSSMMLYFHQHPGKMSPDFFENVLRGEILNNRMFRIPPEARSSILGSFLGQSSLGIWLITLMKRYPDWPEDPEFRHRIFETLTDSRMGEPLPPLSWIRYRNDFNEWLKQNPGRYWPDGVTRDVQQSFSEVIVNQSEGSIAKLKKFGDFLAVDNKWTSQHYDEIVLGAEQFFDKQFVEYLLEIDHQLSKLAEDSADQVYFNKHATLAKALWLFADAPFAEVEILQEFVQSEELLRELVSLQGRESSAKAFFELAFFHPQLRNNNRLKNFIRASMTDFGLLSSNARSRLALGMEAMREILQEEKMLPVDWAKFFVELFWTDSYLSSTDLLANFNQGLLDILSDGNHAGADFVRMMLTILILDHPSFAAAAGFLIEHHPGLAREAIRGVDFSRIQELKSKKWMKFFVAEYPQYLEQSNLFEIVRVSDQVKKTENLERLVHWIKEHPQLYRDHSIRKILFHSLDLTEFLNLPQSQYSLQLMEDLADVFLGDLEAFRQQVREGLKLDQSGFFWNGILTRMGDLQDLKALELREIVFEILQSKGAEIAPGWKLAFALDHARHPELYSQKLLSLNHPIPRLDSNAVEFYRKMLFGSNQELEVLADALEGAANESLEAKNFLSFLRCELCVHRVATRMTEVRHVNHGLLMRIMTNEFEFEEEAYSDFKKAVLSLDGPRVQRLIRKLVSNKEELREVAYDFFDLHKQILAGGLARASADFKGEMSRRMKKLKDSSLDKLVAAARAYVGDSGGSSGNPCDGDMIVLNKAVNRTEPRQ